MFSGIWKGQPLGIDSSLKNQRTTQHWSLLYTRTMKNWGTTLNIKLSKVFVFCILYGPPHIEIGLSLQGA